MGVNKGAKINGKRPKTPRTGLQQLADKAAEGTAEDPIEKACKSLYNSLFPNQKAVIDDPASYIVARCSRRAGKTEMVARWLLMTALKNPKAEILYAAQSAKSARELMWANPKTGLPALIKNFDLEEYVTYNETTSTIEFSNGALVYISGIETKADASKWLGHTFKLVCVDEAQNVTDEVLNYFVRTVIIPTLIDVDGKLLLAGTPKDSCSGEFYNASAGDNKAWSRHHWTLWVNPFMANAQKLVDDEMEKFGEKLSDPGPQRRYWGEWVHEDRVQLYSYMRDRNDFLNLPITDDRGQIIKWNYICGLDLGFRDKTALVIAAWSKQSPNVYFIDSFGKAEMLDQELNAHLKGYRRRFTNLQVVADTGALGLRIIENYQNVYGETILRAEKTEKAATIRLMNSFLRKGQIKINTDTCPELIKEMQRVEIDPNTQIERKSDRCDFADSALYAFKLTYSYIFVPKPIKLSVEEEWLIKARESEQKALDDINRTDEEKMADETERYFQAQQRQFGNFF